MSHKIMLVDDVDISNYIMRRMIENITKEFTILDYTLPEKALEELESVKPTIIFLDVNMPLINGFEFLEHMQRTEIHTPVYVLTSSTSELDEQRAATFANVKGFLIKPISKEKLTSILSELRNMPLETPLAIAG